MLRWKSTTSIYVKGHYIQQLLFGHSHTHTEDWMLYKSNKVADKNRADTVNVCLACLPSSFFSFSQVSTVFVNIGTIGFYRPDALPVTQPTVSKHEREPRNLRHTEKWISLQITSTDMTQQKKQKWRKIMENTYWNKIRRMCQTNFGRFGQFTEDKWMSRSCAANIQIHVQGWKSPF